MSKILVIDTETSGLDPYIHSILSFAGVVIDTDAPWVFLDSIHLRIAEPEIIIDPEAMAVNRIDLDDLRLNGFSPETARRLLDDFLKKHFTRKFGGDPIELRVALAGHKTWFDYGFLQRLYAINGAEPEFFKIFVRNFLDTAGIAEFLTHAGVLKLPNSSLNTLMSHYGLTLPPNERHTALGDAIITYQVLAGLLETTRLQTRGVV